MYTSKLIEEATKQIATLPGIGQKTALRLVLHLLRREENELRALGGALQRLVAGIRYCQSCNGLSEGNICDVCASATREENQQICVVEEIHDLMAIESTGQYHGRYHVLGGLIAPLRGISPEKLKIAHLQARIAATPTQFQEIIFAFSATIEGDITMLYISKVLSEYDLRFSKLARGIPLGSELEYTDTLTLARSISERNPYVLTSNTAQ